MRAAGIELRSPGFQSKLLSLLSHLTNPHQRILKTKRNFLVQRWVTSWVQKYHMPWLTVLTRHKITTRESFTVQTAHQRSSLLFFSWFSRSVVKYNRWTSASSRSIYLLVIHARGKMPVSSWPLQSQVKHTRFDLKFSISMFPSK